MMPGLLEKTAEKIPEKIDKKNGYHSDKYIASIGTEGYKIAVENLAAINSPTEFTNIGPEHAAIVFGNIFKTAKDYVKIYTGNFSGDISNKDYYLNNLKSLLRRHIPISIIFQNDPNEHSLALAALEEFSNSKNISLRKLIKFQDVFQNHFTIADNRMYRMETSVTNYEAECSFNGPDTVNTLDKVFSYLIAFSEVYQKPVAA